MALKKSELYASLWKGCDELRGGMDASQYKDYVLVLLFMKYVSDKYAGKRNASLEVPPGASFADMVKAKNDKEIGDKLNKIIGKLADANDLTGVITVADFNDSDKLGKDKAKVDRLTKLVGIFEALDFSGNRAEGDDLLGDAYEYLMQHFATESGKSKGQFYTPAEVSRIMAKVIGLGAATDTTQTIHDPACGSGSLLLKAHDEARHATGLDLALYGQEMDNATAALARMNTILHGCPSAEIEKGNTLSDPHFKQSESALKTFDFVVANPPFSAAAWTSGVNIADDPFKRFALGTPPPKNGDYAFLLHILTCLKSTGKGAVILPHGVLFRGGAEGGIRREIVRRGYLQGIIGLPANLFYGTGIPACILVLDKQGAVARRGIFMIDAAKGFLKDGNKNRLREQDIHRIVDTFTGAKEQPRYSRMVPYAEIEKNDFNLNLPRYIDNAEPEDLHDLAAHLRGGIPDRDLDALAGTWAVMPGLRAALFAPDRPGYAALRVPAAELKATILGHPDFQKFRADAFARFERWKKVAVPHLLALKQGDRPKSLIGGLSEKLLADFSGAPLLDAYDLYQHLLDYWAATMQDDAYLVSHDGWAARLDGKPNTDLLPPALVSQKFFAAEVAELEQLQAAAEAATSAVEELEADHAGEDNQLKHVRNDKDKVTAASVKARLKAIKGDRDAAEERELLEHLVELYDAESAASKRAKSAAEALDDLVRARYATLAEWEVRELVVNDKWLPAITAAVQGELDRVSQTLTGRLRTLADRYAAPLPKLEKSVDDLASRVAAHLARMGVQA